MVDVENVFARAHAKRVRIGDSFRGFTSEVRVYSPEEANALIAQLISGIKAKDGMSYQALSELQHLAEKGDAYIEGKNVVFTRSSRVSAGIELVKHWESAGEWKNISRYAAYDARTVIGSTVGRLFDIIDLDSFTYGSKGATVPLAVQQYASEALIRTVNRIFSEAVKAGDFEKAADVITGGIGDRVTYHKYPPLPEKERTRLSLELASTHRTDPAVLGAIVTDKRFPEVSRKKALRELRPAANSQLRTRQPIRAPY